jgi:hypothetical protein
MSDKRVNEMAHFSIAHVLRLRDGTYAVRSLDYPACEGHDMDAWAAREEFRAALSEQVRQMIQDGEVPPLYLSLEEAGEDLRLHCKMQVEAADRLPNTHDYAVIVEVDLAAEEAERFAAMRIGELLPATRI